MEEATEYELCSLRKVYDKHSMMFSSGDWEHHVRCVALHNHFNVTMFEHSKTRKQSCYHLETQDVLLEREYEAYVKMICENASIMVTCDPPPQDDQRSRFTGRYCAPHHHRTPSMFHSWNLTVNMKCICRYSPDEHMSVGLE
ncbi:hypothetical protein TNCV_4805111 [Trichonephila clavipes]|nr:hypothetical protein TNCV_4805111 [Trichonephila clavipes]